MRYVALTTLTALLLAAAPETALAQAGLAQVSGEQQLPKPRVFAPGVLTTIPVEQEPEEVTSVHDLIEVRGNKQLDWTPKLLPPSRTLYSKSEALRFRRDVWQLEFAFKPVRMMWVNVPSQTGASQRTLVWYLVYKVTNTGEALSPVEGDLNLYTAGKKPHGPVKFLPHFVLEGHETDAAGQKLYRAYLDRAVPIAIEAIRRRETPGRKLLSSTEMAQQTIAPSKEGEAENSVWGVAMWTGVDPEMDFFSVYVRGLTNAYRWEDPQGAYKPGDPPGKGRKFARKVLQLNFWRPGDRFLEHESEVRFGIAPGKSDLYGVDKGVAYRWIYR